VLFDVVLTFTELQKWLDDENIHLENCSESDFENLGGNRRQPTLPSGRRYVQDRLGSTVMSTDVDVLHVSGAEDVMDLLDSRSTLPCVTTRSSRCSVKADALKRTGI
jgi:iron only hydrogenase large subunit-like protein